MAHRPCNLELSTLPFPTISNRGWWQICVFHDLSAPLSSVNFSRPSFVTTNFPGFTHRRQLFIELHLLLTSLLPRHSHELFTVSAVISFRAIIFNKRQAYRSDCISVSGMPRDLGLEEKSVPLMESPNSTEDTEHPEEGRFVILRGDQDQAGSEKSMTPFKLHPYTRPLTISDLESCVALEQAAFPENERCSREKVS